jgi:hypothetical protein
MSSAQGFQKSLTRRNEHYRYPRVLYEQKILQQR